MLVNDAEEPLHLGVPGVKKEERDKNNKNIERKFRFFMLESLKKNIGVFMAVLICSGFMKHSLYCTL